jgi:pyruvate/2-oxoglutarate dehydrogenase complex dihydrolipoamide acyltransferase (E2) component
MSAKAAATPVIMPKLGAYTEDILLVQWLVDEGQEVAAGQVVLELETEKTNAEVEADSAGFVHRRVAAGETVPIGTTVGLIAATREEYDELVGGTEAAADGTGEENGHPFLGYIGHGGGATVAQAAGAATPAQPRPAAATPREARQAGPLVAPRARALMKELGLSPEVAREIEGTGPGGRILDRDVAAWAAAREGAAAPAVDADALTVTRTIPLRGRRKTIATRMVGSLQTAAQLTSVLELDVKPLVELREALNERRTERKIGVTAIVVKLVATALREHPGLNARVTDTGIELLGEINVAVAVDTDEGLVAPVVAGADRLSIEQIDDRIAELATRARERALDPGDLAGGTFTVSNGGIYPVDITTAILNPPQVGILWIGRIKDRPVVVGDGAIAVRPTMQACLTFDHRAVDGGPAAAFLATLERLVTALPEGVA